MTREQQSVLYICHAPSTPDHHLYRFSEAERKKVNGVIALLERVNIHAELIPLAPINQGYIEQLGGFSFRAHIRILYWLLRPIFEIRMYISSALRILKARDRICAVIIYNYYFPCLLLAIYCRLTLGTPVILDYEDGLHLAPKKRIFRSILERIVKKVADGYILVNQNLLDRLPPNKPMVVLNGVFSTTLSEQRMSSHSHRLLYSGNINRDNGLELLIAAVSTLDLAGIGVDITGGGKDIELLKAHIEKNNLKHVTYHGFVSIERLTQLEESATGYILFQNTDSPIYSTNFPSKLFHFIQLSKPVFFNRCEIFSPYSIFENAYPLDEIDELPQILEKALEQGINHAAIKTQIELYNNKKSVELSNLVSKVVES